jgi:hypothetical protein
MSLLFRNRVIVIFTCILLLNSSCEKEVFDGLFSKDNPLSTEEVIIGLKTALAVGTDSSTSVLSAVNGYYGDALLKILLPPEANIIYQYKDNALVQAIGITTLLNNTILAINRAAESAAKEAAPIFKESITSLSVAQAWDILNGVNPVGTKSSENAFDSTAATNYFRVTTITSLTNLYAPKIDNSLSQDLGLGFTANQAWNTLISSYNTVANSLAGQVAGIKPATNNSLGVYCTEKALNGLFFKVGEQEKSIRHNPYKWINTAVGDILTKVFGKKS